MLKETDESCCDGTEFDGYTQDTLKLSEVECCFGTRVADIELQAMDYKSSACPYLFFSPGTDVPGATLQPVIIGPMPQSVSPKAELLHVFPVARPQPESPVTSLQFDFQRGTGHWHQPDSSEHASPQDANLLHDKLQPASAQLVCPEPASQPPISIQQAGFQGTLLPFFGGSSYGGSRKQ